MATKEHFTVLIAIADKGDLCHIDQLMHKYSGVHLTLEHVSDPYSLIEDCRELVPDLLIVSPIILSDPMVYTFKEVIGRHDIKIISYCNTLAEVGMNKHFDAKILSTDSVSELENVLESVLVVESRSDKESILTPREQDVVISVVKGLTNKEIADRLFLSTHTIITHRRNIARKLNIHSPSGLTIYAIMNKLVTLEEIKEHI